MKNFDILQVSARARLSKSTLPLYNGTAGMLFDEDGKLFNFTSVRKELLEIAPTLSFLYPPSSGDNIYQDTIKKYIFNEFDKSLVDKFDAIITLGGTGALSLIAFKERSKNYILPNIMWSNYLSIFNLNNDDYLSYEIFDINSIKNALNNSISKDGDTILLINDPAQNPIGYTMNEKDYLDLIDLLNSFSKNHKLTLIMDIAYNDYGEDPSRPFVYCNKLNKDIRVYYTFSASKSFGIYSLRTGALLYKKDEALSKEFSLLARGIYSCPVTLGSQIIYNIVSDENLYKSFKKELSFSKDLLKNRGNTLLSLLDKYHFEYLPYKDGFYITLKNVKDAYKLCEKLEERNCFIIPLDNSHIRIAISSLKTSSLKDMMKLIDEVYHEI